ncbi:MAG: hypothetical protein ABJA98_10855 [Acidobacteriota bacterium]
MSGRASSWNGSLLVLVVVWALSAAYASQFMYRGWIAHDDGTLGQSAERVLEGELPHRDFVDGYSGGLSYVHAAAMVVLGVSLGSLRLFLFGVFLLYVPACYFIARRFARPVTAGLVTLICVAWSVPNYFVGMPSWYNLFLATFGVLAFLKFIETDRRRWLVAAGVCGGLSVLVIIVGLYYLAGGLLCLAYVEQSRVIPQQSEKIGRSSVYATFVSLACVAFAGILLVLFGRRPSVGIFLALFAPVVVVALSVVWGEWTTGGGFPLDRARTLLRLVAPFAFGAGIPIALFVIAYWRQDALGDLMNGLFILPQRRFQGAARELVPAAALVVAMPFAALVVPNRSRFVLRETGRSFVLAAWLGAVLISCRLALVYQMIWVAIRALPLIAVLAGVELIFRRSGPSNLSANERARVFLLITMSAVVALVQFPFAAPIYVCFAAPLTILALLAVVSGQANAPKRFHACAAVFFFLFAVLLANRSHPRYLGVRYVRYEANGWLDLPRGGVRVPNVEKRDYEALVRVIQQHAAGGIIYAGPDCPEVYFLSGFKNPTRTFFEFLDPQEDDLHMIARLVSQRRGRVAVINTDPEFSPPLSRDAQALLERQLPASERVGRFVVRYDP